MKKINVEAFAKINLTLDVLGILDNGFHEVEMIMQQILLSDTVNVSWEEDPSLEGIDIRLTTNRKYLPTDSRNLAFRAALLMAEKYGKDRSGHISINIKKRIPVAAGLAGGSSNAAALLHCMNRLWDLDLSVSELSAAGAELGSDVPFCIMGQAAADKTLRPFFTEDPLACHCALASGTGTDMQPLKGLRRCLVISKPPVSVSTAKVYQGIDSVHVPEHPDNQEMIRALESGSARLIRKNMINVLENFTLKHYTIAMYTKHKMQELCRPDEVLMSGSGPAVFGLCKNIRQSRYICSRMLSINKESFWTRTTW